MNEIIHTERLFKAYGQVHAVEDLNLHINRGEIYGFLGLNGAGKTTTIRMLLGMISPSSGAAFIKGRRIVPGEHALWNSIGYLVEIPYAYPELTVLENLEIARRMRMVPQKESIPNIIEKLQLGAYVHRKAKDLSQGNAQRLGLAKALIHQPEIIFLDEPANALDPAGIVEIRELLREMAGIGATIFISSHILGEISRIASRIGIIHNGQLIRELNHEELETLLSRKLVVELKNSAAAQSLFIEKGFHFKMVRAGRFEFHDTLLIEDPGQLSTLLVQHNNPPFYLAVEEEDLESFFLRSIGMKGENP